LFALTDAAIRYPIRCILIGFALTLSTTAGLFRLELRTDGHALVPEYAPELQTDRKIRAAFGIHDPVIILVQSDHSDGVFNPLTLRFVEEITAELGRLPGVDAATITSLATEASFHHRPNSLQFATLLENMPNTPEESRRLRDDVRRIELYTGTVVGFDEKSTAIYVGTPADRDRVQFFSEIKTALGRLSIPGTDRVQVIGAPVAEALLGLHILEDLGVPSRILGASTFVDDETGLQRIPKNLFELRRWVARGVGLLPVTILVMAAIFLIFFGRLAAAAIPLIEVGACLYFVFGLMGLLSIPIYLTIAVVPIILVANGVCDEIHVLSRYRRNVRLDPAMAATRAGRTGIVRETMRDMWGPVVRTSITTGVGFLSFVWAPIEPVKMFGIVTTIGVMFCMIWSLTVMPALLVLLDARRVVRVSRAPSTVISSNTGGEAVTLRSTSDEGSGRQAALSLESSGGCAQTDSREHRFFDRLASILIARRALVAASFALVLLITVLGIRRVVVQDSWIDGFESRSQFRAGTDLFNRQFFGTHILQLCVDGTSRPFSYSLNSDELIEWQYPIRGNPGRPFSEYLGDRFIMSGEATIETAQPFKRPAGRPRGPTTRPVEGASKTASNLVTRVVHWYSSIAELKEIDGRLCVATPRYDGLPIYWMKRNPPIEVKVDVGTRPMTAPRVVAAIGRLAAFVRGRAELAVGGVLGAFEFVSTTGFMIRPDVPGSRKVPGDVREIESLWSKYAFVRGPQRVRQVVTKDFSKSLATVYLREANFVDTAKLMDDIRAYEQTELAPKGLKLEFAGDVAVSQALIGAIVTTQLQSLVFSLIGIFLGTALLGRSLLYGLYCTLPCALSLPIVFAAMGWMGIPLGVATSMFAAMILGAGVDFAIHVLDRFRAEHAGARFEHASARISSRTADAPSRVRESLLAPTPSGIPSRESSESELASSSKQNMPPSPDAAIRAALRETGFPVTVNALALSAGFLVLTLSQVPANARLGLLLAIGLLSCLFVSLLLLPGLLKWRPA